MRVRDQHAKSVVTQDSSPNATYLPLIPDSFPPTTDNRQPTTDNRQPTTDNRQPTTDNRQPTTDNQQLRPYNTMRITILNPIGEVGGAEGALLASIRGARAHLPDARLDVVLLAGGPLEAEAS